MHNDRPYYPPRAYRTHIPWRLALAVLALLLLVVLLGQLRAAFDPQVREAAERAAYRQQDIDARLDGLDLVVAGGWKVFPLLLVAGASIVSLLALYNRLARWASVQADKVIDLQRATVQRFPTGLQSLSFHDSSRPQLLPPDEIQPALLPAGDVPAFAELLAHERIGKGHPLVLGFDTESGQELTGSWLDLYSTAVSGMPGSGKTTSQRFLACQTALHGAKFAICDPHAGAADDSLAATLAPLAAVFVCEPASTDKAILNVVRYIADVGRRRVSGQDRDTTPLILWVDELTALLGRSSIAEPLADLLEQVAQEYRKRWVFVCASGQIWTAARTTSELRDSFASVLCHRMKRAQARLLLPIEEAEQVERLQTGRAVLWRTSGATQVIDIPNTTARDCTQVGELLRGGPAPATSWHMPMPDGSLIEAASRPFDQPGGSQTVAEAAWLPTASVSAEAARAASMFLDGLDPAQIVWELRQVRSNQGGKYQAALGEVLGLVRDGLRARR